MLRRLASAARALFSSPPRAQPRPDMRALRAEMTDRRTLAANYDAASASSEFANYWAAADSLDADSANSRAVRDLLVPRSRYEAANNGIYAGIVRSYATDLVGTGPRLRMTSGSENFNRMVEREWHAWARVVGLRRKLWTMAHAKCVDGESWAVMRTNRAVDHPVKFDLVLHETEQFQSPWLMWGDVGEVDGMETDDDGNPTTYKRLPFHPGGLNFIPLSDPEDIPARYVCHWFALRRPGQHRGVPDLASTLHTGAAARRYREATLAAAESAAAIALWLKTNMIPGQSDEVAPLSEIPWDKRQAVAAPMGWEPVQMKAEHPNATYQEFCKSLVSEQARPVSMPYNRAAADSSNSNFASGRLDFLPYHAQLDFDREDVDELVLHKVFALWFAEAVQVFGWLGGNPNNVGRAALLHAWDWPAHQALDQKAEAFALEKKLKVGAVTLPRHYADQGLDFEDEMHTLAEAFALPVDVVKRRIFDTLFPPAAAARPPADPADQDAREQNELELAESDE